MKFGWTTLLNGGQIEIKMLCCVWTQKKKMKEIDMTENIEG